MVLSDNQNGVENKNKRTQGFIKFPDIHSIRLSCFWLVVSHDISVYSDGRIIMADFKECSHNFFLVSLQKMVFRS